ncbi:MAG: hypothetical protein V4438_00450 [Patescibacteria group bacterium]
MVSKIITHNRPHADELVALMMLRKFPEGEQKFLGVRQASVSFMRTGEIGGGKTANDFPDTIFLGVGGGEFDEHATSQKNRTEGECCATLVAKSLGIDKDPGLQKILTFVKSEDLKGTKVKNELPMIIKFLHQFSEDQEKISKWAEDAYYAEYISEKNKWESLAGNTKENTEAERLWKEMKGKWQRPTLESTFALLKSQDYKDLAWWISFAEEAIKFQDKRFKDAEMEFESKGKIEKIVGPYGAPITLASITSDNEEMNKCARNKGADIVVQFSSRGNTAIFTRRPANLDLTFVFVLLRMAEQHYGGRIFHKDEEVLSKEGIVEGIPEWYLGHSHDIGFNGSMTASDIPPTKIPHEKIIALVKEGLRPR